MVRPGARLRPVPGTEQWAADAQGPLMVSPDGGGQTRLALFQGEPEDRRATAGFHRVAFRLTAPDWLAFVARLITWPPGNRRRCPRRGPRRGVVGVFQRPARSPAQVTTYEAELVRRARG